MFILSVIVPIYNESQRIKNIIEISRYLRRQRFSSELIIVDDGSTDRTISKLKKISKQISLKIISYRKNQGKGFAIKSGMLKSKGQYKLFIDVDLSTPIEELAKFLPYLTKQHVIIGTRKVRGASLRNRQPFLRESLGKGFTLLSRIILQLDISDFTCGFKLFSKKAANEIFSRQKIDRWGFDTEILFLAKKLGFSIKEIPVTWSNDPNSKVKIVHDVISSFIDLCKIRYYEFKKMYSD